MSTDLAINLHRDAITALGKLMLRHRKAVAEWYRVTAELGPTRGVQAVVIAPKLAEPLVAVGLLKHRAKGGYYVPRNVAFVSHEPAID